MARLARLVVVDVPHHVTQRGNARQYVLSTDAERAVYLGLLGQHVRLYELSLWGYCLMSNHVHLITVPHRGICGISGDFKDRISGTLGTSMIREELTEDELTKAKKYAATLVGTDN